MFALHYASSGGRAWVSPGRRGYLEHTRKTPPRRGVNPREVARNWRICNMLVCLLIYFAQQLHTSVWPSYLDGKVGMVNLDVKGYRVVHPRWTGAPNTVGYWVIRTTTSDEPLRPELHLALIIVHVFHCWKLLHWPFPSFHNIRITVSSKVGN